MLFARNSFCMILQMFHITTKVGFIFESSKSISVFVKYLTFVRYFSGLFYFICDIMLKFT